MLCGAFLIMGVCVTLLGTTWASKSRLRSCGQGHFYDTSDEKCKKCSICPDNQIIQIPCSESADLVCGPFNFEDFRDFDSESPVSYPDLLEDFDDDSDTHVYESNKARGVLPRGGKFQYAEEETTTVEKEDREYWRTLAFALIGVLSVLIIVATVVVFVACRKLQRDTVIKQTEEGDMDDADSGYVVIRAIRNIADSRPGIADHGYNRDDYESHPPLLSALSLETDPPSVIDPFTHPHPGRLRFLPKVYTPQRRLLNYDTDDVFESDDSGGSAQPTYKSKLRKITENSDSSGSRNSGSNSKESPSALNVNK